MAQRNKNRAGGFTLVELLVATVIISIVMLTVYHTFSAGLAAWNRTESDLGPLEDGRNFLANFRSELGSVSLPLPADELSFLGLSERVSFFTGNGLSDRSITPAAATTRVTYFLQRPAGPAAGQEQQPQTFSVVRNRQFFAGSQRIGDESGAAVLTGVREFHLHYLYPQTTPQELKWSDTWQTPGDPPVAVRIDLVLEKPGRDKTRTMSLSTTVPLLARPAPKEVTTDASSPAGGVSPSPAVPDGAGGSDKPDLPGGAARPGSGTSGAAGQPKRN